MAVVELRAQVSKYRNLDEEFKGASRSLRRKEDYQNALLIVIRRLYVQPPADLTH